MTGLRQGCILSPLLFITVIDFVMRKAVTGTNVGIKWGRGRLTDLDFTDDLALVSHTQLALQEMTNNLREHGEKIRLRISQDKTKAMAVGQQHPPPLTLGGQDIEYVDNFTYLESNISSTGDIENGIINRVGKASGVFQRLQNI